MIKKADSLQPIEYENRFGGQGKIAMKPLLSPEEFCGKGRLLSHTFIYPGSSIGEHTHQGDFETYYILKGTGVVNDNGTLTQVGPGDVVYTGSGKSHSIENTGSQDLELIAMILFDA
jgi:mannose-6-phosphate isomerase-like protein (cupin superfamily)